MIDRHRRLAHVILVPIEVAPEFEDGSPTPEHYAEQQECYKQLYRALEQLAPGQQELIRLRYSRNMSTREIAHRLGKSEEAVRQLYSRTIRQLRGIYHQREGGKQP